MKGAREYAELFISGQYGRLYLESREHARGKTFRVFVLPYSEPRFFDEKNAVEVYGIIGGQPGWTEEYGWLHHGPWVADFEKIVEARRAEIAEADARQAKDKADAEAKERRRIVHLLANYKSGGKS